MLFATSLVALVGSGTSPQDSPRRLQILNTKRDSVICELSFTSAILSVKLNRKRLVVVLEDHIYLYDIANMKLVHTIDTAPNPNALCALSPSSENCFLAYPPSTTGASAGDLLVFDALNLQAVNIIQAHKSALTCIQFSYDGTLVATASDKGTVIRVFSIPTGQTLFQLRRGTYTAQIHSLSFSLCTKYLSVSSDSETIHIFSLLSDQELLQKRRASLPAAPSSTSNSSEPHSISKYIGSLLTSPLATSTTSTIQSLLPSQLKDPFTPQRDFAFAKIPQTAKGFQNMVALIGGPGVMSLPGPGADDLEGLGGSTVGAPLQLVVVSGNGLVYVFSVDREVGGECVQVKEFSLLEEED
ncbi:autophagy protein [Rhizoclosmatium sp. JEL0117]|nr:autophagy protein [Rhizoclosmatium hyalinum]KAJ3292943.1 autophagy protein [Rhizoclosmatium sp. JEL0117]